MLTIGLDLASQKDFTAISFLETTREKGVLRHSCGWLDRWQDTYPRTVARVTSYAKIDKFRNATIVADQTGVGRPVVDMLREALPGRKIYGITITAGSVPTRGEHAHDIRVPKKLLVSTLQVLLAERRMTFSKEMPLVKVLQNELANFKVKITAALNETYEAWREADHDDLVLAMGLAAWLAENGPKPLTDQRVSELVLSGKPDRMQAASGEVARTRVEELADDLPELFGAD